MSKRKPEAAPVVAADPATSPARAEAAVVLHYTGGPVYGDAPARDLTAAELAYVHRVGALRTSGGVPVPAASDADIAALAESLEATGSFSRNDPAAAEGPAAPADPAEEN